MSSIWQTGSSEALPAFVESVRYYGKLRPSDGKAQSIDGFPILRYNIRLMAGRLTISLLSALLLAAAASPAARADESSPVMLSLLDPVQWPSSQSDVSGFRLSILYGECADFAGLDIGLVGRATGDFRGLSIGGVNIVSCRLIGLQVGLINWNLNGDDSSARRSIGVQYGFLNYVDSLLGLQDGWINTSSGRVSGLQYGLLNCADDVNGVQCGTLLVLGVNVAVGSVSGCQIGIVNYAGRMDSGAQIGLVNVIAHGGFFPVLPIVNGGF